MSDYNGYSINLAENLSPMVVIKNKGQGPCPKLLSGYFTTRYDAERAIDFYLNQKKGTTSGSTKGISTD